MVVLATTTDSDRGFVNGFGMRVARSFGPSYAAMGTHTGYTAPWGESHRDFFANHFANHLMVFMFGEDLPVETNTVTLAPEVADSDGIPAAHVTRPLPGTSWGPAGWATPRRTRCSTSGARRGICPICSSWTDQP